MIVGTLQCSAITQGSVGSAYLGGIDVVFEVLLVCAVANFTFVFAPSHHHAKLTPQACSQTAFGRGKKDAGFAQGQVFLHGLFPSSDVISCQLCCVASVGAVRDARGCAEPCHVAIEVGQSVGTDFHALSQVFNQSDCLCTTHGSLGVGQSAHLHSQNTQNAQRHHGDSDQGFD